MWRQKMKTNEKKGNKRKKQVKYVKKNKGKKKGRVKIRSEGNVEEEER